LEAIPKPNHDQVGWPWTEAINRLPLTMPDGSTWPRISVVTPSLNQIEYLEETIRSVLLQGYPNLEYIIIDGGSTDGSLEIIRKYEPWLTYWISEPDRGQSHAINKGFQHSSGAIMAYLNSDDSYLPDTLKIVASTFNHSFPDILIGALQRLTLSADIDPVNEILYPDSGNPVHLFPIFKNHRVENFRCLQPSLFWTRSIWQVTGQFNENLHYMMDREWCLRALARGASVHTIPDVLTRYTVHPGSKSHDQNLKFSGEMVPIYRTLSRMREFHRIFCWLEATNYYLANLKDTFYLRSSENHKQNRKLNSVFNLFAARILRRLRLPIVGFGNYCRSRASIRET